MYRISIMPSGAYAVEMEGEYAELMEDIVDLAQSGDPVIIVSEIEDLDNLSNLTIDSKTVKIIEGGD